MGFGGGEKGKVVAAVGVGGVQDGQKVPQPGNGQVGAHDQRTRKHWEEAGNVVLHWMGVHGSDSNRGRPLMVDLVEVLVETGVVE